MAKKKPQTTIPSPTAATAVPGPSSSGTTPAGVAPLSGMPPYGGGSQKQVYLGVPNDTTFPAMGPNLWGEGGPPELTTTTPQYLTGDEYRQLPSNKQDLITLQQAMISSGLIPPGDAARIVLGSPDPITVGGFKSLLVSANIQGADWRSALADRLNSTPAPTKPKSTPPLTIQLSNPDDIKAVAQSAAKALNGTYLDDNSLNAFITSYQAQERAYQTQVYNQRYDPGVGYGPGGEATAPPAGAGLQLELENKIRETQPASVGVNEFTSAFMPVLQSLTKPSAPIAGIK